MSHPIALITGAAHRIGKAISLALHQNGYHVVIHCNRSQSAAKKFVAALNQARKNSASWVSADLLQLQSLPKMLDQILDQHGHLDVLINNASSFYPTPLGSITLAQWDDLVGTNLKAPLFLAQAAKPALLKTQGQIINITDLHATRPLKNFSTYSIAKAGLQQLTRCLAKELAPAIRVNAVAPGAILWPEGETELSAINKQKIIAETAVKRVGEPENIAAAVLFLLQSGYITGQTLTVDGGRHL